MRDWYLTSKASLGWGHCCGPCRLGFKKPNHRSQGAWMYSGMEWNVHTFGVGVSPSRMLSPLLLLWKPEKWVFEAQQVIYLNSPWGCWRQGTLSCQMPFPVFHAVQPFHWLHVLTSLHVWEVSAGRVSDKTSLSLAGIQSTFSQPSISKECLPP